MLEELGQANSARDRRKRKGRGKEEREEDQRRFTDKSWLKMELEDRERTCCKLVEKEGRAKVEEGGKE